jgi:hypothetical protein
MESNFLNWLDKLHLKRSFLFYLKIVLSVIGYATYVDRFPSGFWKESQSPEGGLQRLLELIGDITKVSRSINLNSSCLIGKFKLN